MSELSESDTEKECWSHGHSCDRDRLKDNFCHFSWNFQFFFVSLTSSKLLTFLRPYGSKRYAITKEKIKKSSFYFVLCSLIRIFAPSPDSSFLGGGRSNIIVGNMEEKRYPRLEEEDGFGCMNAAEPMETRSYTEMSAVDVVIMRGGVEELPQGFNEPFAGPSTYEEAIARIEEAEREIERGETYDWEDVLSEAKQRVKQYAAEIY